MANFPLTLQRNHFYFLWHPDFDLLRAMAELSFIHMNADFVSRLAAKHWKQLSSVYILNMYVHLSHLYSTENSILLPLWNSFAKYFQRAQIQLPTITKLSSWTLYYLNHLYKGEGGRKGYLCTKVLKPIALCLALLCCIPLGAKGLLMKFSVSSLSTFKQVLWILSWFLPHPVEKLWGLPWDFFSCIATANLDLFFSSSRNITTSSAMTTLFTDVRTNSSPRSVMRVQLCPNDFTALCIIEQFVTRASEKLTDSSVNTAKAPTPPCR